MVSIIMPVSLVATVLIAVLIVFIVRRSKRVKNYPVTSATRYNDDSQGPVMVEDCESVVTNEGNSRQMNICLLSACVHAAACTDPPLIDFLVVQ